MPYIQKLISEKDLKESYLNYNNDDSYSRLNSDGKDIVDLLEEFRANRLKNIKSKSSQ